MSWRRTIEMRPRRVPEAPFLVLVVLFVLSGQFVSKLLGVQFPYSSQILFGKGIRAALSLYLISLLLYTAVVLMYRYWRNQLVERGSLFDKDAWPEFWELHVRRVLGKHLQPSRILSALLVLGAVSVLMNTFIYFKTLIPTVHPFRWDVTFARLDAWIHGGRQPWQHLEFLFDTPHLVWLLDRAYLAWYPVVLMTLAWQAWSGREPFRSRFMLAYGLMWVISGVALATVFSSAGPCFLGAVTGDSTFVPLLDRLRTIDASRHLAAPHLQEYLWQGYTGQSDHAIEGVSAMPSLHVGISTLVALLLNSHALPIRVAGWTFAAVTLIGSVMLAWHYAIDGYVAVVLALMTWWLSGWISSIWKGGLESC